MGLFTPVWNTKDKKKLEEAISAVKKMADDQSKLVKVAKTAYLADVRLAAISMITDEAVLCDIALSDNEFKNACEAINRIHDKNYLERILRESSDEYVKGRCQARLVCGDIDFDNISSEELVSFFSELDKERFDTFALTEQFEVALTRFLEDDYPAHFAQVPEEIAKKIWWEILYKRCHYYGINPQAHGLLDENRIKDYAPLFKKIWEVSPYQSFKDLISQFIWPYSVEVAEYMLLNNVAVNHLDTFLLSRREEKLIATVDDKKVLSHAAENNDSEIIRQLASEKLRK